MKIKNKSIKGGRICFVCGCRISVSKHYIGCCGRIKYLIGSGVYFNNKWVCLRCFKSLFGHLFKYSDKLDSLVIKDKVSLRNEYSHLNTNYTKI